MVAHVYFLLKLLDDLSSNTERKGIEFQWHTCLSGIQKIYGAIAYLGIFILLDMHTQHCEIYPNKVPTNGGTIQLNLTSILHLLT